MRNLNLSMGLNICRKSNPKPLKIDKKQMSGIKDEEKFLLKLSRNRFLMDHFIDTSRERKNKVECVF